MWKLTDIQILKLGKTIHHIKNSNFFYGQNFSTDRVTTPDDLAKIPFMSYQILMQGYPFAYSCADTRELVYGSLRSVEKEPVMNLFTDNDISHIVEMTSRAFSLAEITDEDTILLLTEEEKSFAIAETAKKLKHFLIPANNLSCKKVLQLIQDTGTTSLAGDISDLVKFVDECRESSLDLSETEIRTGIFCGKSLKEGARNHILRETGMTVYTAASAGIFLHGLGCDCEKREGFHIWDDHYIAEIIDPETGKHVEDGSEGELVVTTLSLEALPLIRFRTGKTAKIVSREKCRCGLHTPKISYIY